MRLEAERKMAEAERMLREQETERARLEAQAKAIHSSAEAPAPVSNDDDLLGISLEPVRTAPDAIQHDVSDVEDDIHLSIKPAPRAKIDLREIAKKSEPAIPIVAELSDPTAPPVVAKVEAPVAIETEPYLLDEPETDSSKSVHESDAAVAFSGPYFSEEPKRSGVPMTMIAGVAVAVLIAAGLGFVFLGGSSSNTETPATPATQQAAAPVQPAEQPAAAPVQTDQPAQQQPEQVNAFTPETSEVKTETPAAAKPVQTAKAKPAEKPKAPAAKKPVTADDLINDN
jgi:hypothetical protein